MQARAELLSNEDLYLFNTGQLFRSYQTFGAHPVTFDGQKGVRFAVWAPNAREVSVVCDCNGWGRDNAGYSLERIGTTGVWCGFVAGMGEGDRYKYAILNADGQLVL